MPCFTAFMLVGEVHTRLWRVFQCQLHQLCDGTLAIKVIIYVVDSHAVESIPLARKELHRLLEGQSTHVAPLFEDMCADRELISTPILVRKKFAVVCSFLLTRFWRTKLTWIRTWMRRIWFVSLIWIIFQKIHGSSYRCQLLKSSTSTR